APAFWVLGRLSFLAGFSLAAFLFVLPTGLALWLSGPEAAALPPGAGETLVAVLVLVAIWFLLALRAFMSFGITRMIRLSERIASGELVEEGVREDAVSGNHDAALLWASIMKMNRSLAGI